MKPSIGRIVHVRIAPDVWRPAIIVAVWSDTCVNLQAFTDGYNDRGLIHGPGTAPNVAWMTSVEHGDVAHEGNVAWRWPPRT